MKYNNIEFKEIPGYPTYYASECGKIYSEKQANRRKGNGLLSQSVNNVGYVKVGWIVNDKIKVFSVHRLVALTFIPNPNNYTDVNHIDGNKLNNNISNLEWCSHSTNINHGRKLGLFNKLINMPNPNLGKKVSKETRALQSACKIGKKHPKFKGYINTPFGKFESSYAAAIPENKNKQYILRKIKSDPINYYYSNT